MSTTTSEPLRVLALVLALAAARCTPTLPAPDVAAHDAAIYWGEPEDDYDGVVRLTITFNLLAGAQCSGTLVSTRVVVTAQHCVIDEEGAPISPADIVVETGPAGTSAQYAVEEIRSLDGGSLSGQDMAVLITEDEVDAAPYAYATEWDGRPGDPVLLVGYGQREDGESGRKYRGDNEVGYVFDTYFTTTGEAGCHGDSGGPAFDEDGVLVGVIVNTIGGWVEGEDTCLSGVSGLTRVDTFHDLVDEAVDDSWVCFDDPAETCGNGRDDDCNRLIDEGCLGLGASCADAVACASADCRDFGDGARCTASCTVGLGAQCDEGFYCDEVACGEGACVAGVAGPGVLGAHCETDADCGNLSCLATGDARRCLRPCAGDDACTAGEACADPDDDGCGGCAPEDDGAPFDAPCTDGGDCASGLCVADAFGSLCSAPCGAGCPDGFACDPDGQCVRGPVADLPLGSPCADAASCASGACEDVGGTRLCTDACDAGACPTGFTCAADRCEPSAAPAGQGCAENPDCLSGLCGNFGDYRACTQECSEDAPCADGLICEAGDEGAYCRPRTPPVDGGGDGGDGGGCGCRQAPIRGSGPATWMLAVFLAVVATLARPRGPGE